MIISLIFGVLLGAALVVFVLQNVAVVTVAFLSWQITGSLALVLLASIISGVVVTLLIILPSLIKNDFYLASIKREKKALEDQLAQARKDLASWEASAPRTNTITVEKTVTHS